MSEGRMLALSAAQLGIWVGQAIHPRSTAYWTAQQVFLRGDLHQSEFMRALDEVLGEAEVLHQRFMETERGVVQVSRASTRNAEFFDFGGERFASSAADAWIVDDLDTIPDLEKGPTYRAALLRLAASEWRFYLRAHHVVLDGYGYHLIQKSVAERYGAYCRGESPGTIPLPPLRALIDEDLAYQNSEERTRDLAYFRSLMAGSEARTIGPTRSWGGAVHRIRRSVSPELFAQLRAECRREKLEWTALLIAIAARFFAPYFGPAPFRLGIPVAGRFGSIGHRLPAMMMNILPLRVEIDAEGSVVELARRVSSQLRSSRPHQRLRCEELRRAEGGVSRPFFGPIINILAFAEVDSWHGIDAAVVPVAAGPVEDLSLTFLPEKAGLRLDWDANAAAYGREEVGALADEFMAELMMALEEPGRRAFGGECLPKAALAEGAAAPDLEFWGRLLEAERSARESTALVDAEGNSLSYSGLLTRVRRLAEGLRSRGTGEGDRVLLLLSRGTDAVLLQLAVLWCGAAFVPFEPEGPRERLLLVVATASPTLVVARAEYAELLGDPGISVVAPEELERGSCVGIEPAAVSPGQPAYVIFTSGSTGRPNGVVISRRALMSFVDAARARYELSSADRLLQFAPLSFDASIEEIYCTLFSSATLVLRSADAHHSFRRFFKECAERRVTVLDLPTAFWHEMADSFDELREELPLVRLVIIGGEAAKSSIVARWNDLIRGRIRLLNTYGPTETTVVALTSDLGRLPLGYAGEVPIGTPLLGIGAVVLDEVLQEVREGEVGDLWLYGPTLASGYLGDESATRARFRRLLGVKGRPRGYLTGDRVAWRGGEFVYCGRRDDEVKISGIRVHPLEIEVALEGFGRLREWAVTIQRREGSPRLTLHYASERGDDCAEEIRSYLSGFLPHPAVPALYARHETLPRDPHGKVDRRRLAAEEVVDEELVSRDEPMVEEVLSLVADVLGRRVTRETHFFGSGGTSLDALRLATRLRSRFSVDVTIASILRFPTVEGLVSHLKEDLGNGEVWGADGFAPRLVLQSGAGPALFCVAPVDGLCWCYAGLGQYLPGLPIYGLQDPSLSGRGQDSFEALVAHYESEILAAQDEGPYALLGWSSGGGYAHELATRLLRRGHEVRALVMLDSYPSSVFSARREASLEDALIAMLDDPDECLKGRASSELTIAELLSALRGERSSLRHQSEEDLLRLARFALRGMALYRNAEHSVWPGDIEYFRASERPGDGPESELWRPYVRGQLRVLDVKANHLGMCRPSALEFIGRALALRLLQGSPS